MVPEILDCLPLNFLDPPPSAGILDTILSVQPKEGGGGGGETRESIVYQLADDMLRKLPAQYNAYEVRENLTRMGILLPMNIFLRQVTPMMAHDVHGNKRWRYLIAGRKSIGCRGSLNASTPASATSSWRLMAPL